MTNIVLENALVNVLRTRAKLPIRLVADYEHNAVVELFMTNNGYLFIHILTFDFGFMVSKIFIATT